jgi:hypothetical protein
MKQPNALRLAEALYAAPETGAMPDDIQQAADELVRLYGASQVMLEALKGIADLYDTDEGCRTLPQYIAARAAIAKGEQQ